MNVPASIIDLGSTERNGLQKGFSSRHYVHKDGHVLGTRADINATWRTGAKGRRDTARSVGEKVRLHGLCNNAALNGMCGTCTKWHAEMGRWEVRLENAKTLHVKPDNIQSCSHVPNSIQAHSGSPVAPLPAESQNHIRPCSHVTPNNTQPHSGSPAATPPAEPQNIIRPCSHVKPNNTQPHSGSPVATPPAEPKLRVGTRVRIRGLRTRPELNGLVGCCEHLVAETSRWDVKLEALRSEAETSGWLNLKPENLEVMRHQRMALPSNDGWHGKTVGTWLFAAQEEVDVAQDVSKLVITVHATGEKVVCTDMGGKEVAMIDTISNEATLGQIRSAVAKSCGCGARAVELLTPDGRTLLGLGHWTLAEAKVQ